MYHFLRYLSSLTLGSVLSPWGFSIYSFHCLKCSSPVYLAHCCLLGSAETLFITYSPLVAFTPTPSLDTHVISPHFISFLPHITKYSYFILAICIVLSPFTRRQVLSFRIFLSLPVDFKKIPRPLFKKKKKNLASVGFCCLETRNLTVRKLVQVLHSQVTGSLTAYNQKSLQATLREMAEIWDWFSGLGDGLFLFLYLLV